MMYEDLLHKGFVNPNPNKLEEISFMYLKGKVDGIKKVKDEMNKYVPRPTPTNN